LAEPIKLKNATRGSVTNVSAFSLFSKATCTQCITQGKFVFQCNASM
jgi:hypothetical protein